MLSWNRPHMKSISQGEHLDDIIQKTIVAIESGKQEIFQFSEELRENYATHERELKAICIKLKQVISDSDKLEMRSRIAHNRLEHVLAHLDTHDTDDLESVRALTRSLKLEYALKQHEERELRTRRDTLERWLYRDGHLIKRSEALQIKIGTALEYLRGDVIDRVEDNRKLGIQIMRAQENEKRRMAREMHDGPAQMLANIHLKADYISKTVSQSPKSAQKELSDLKHEASEALTEIRKVIYDLMPLSLDDLGLVPTLKRLAHDLQASTRMEVSFSAEEGSVIDNLLVRQMVFRVVQEAYQNIAKHARARHVQTSVTITQNDIVVVIEDDGVGMDDADVKNALSQGFGLHIMRDRMSIIGGRLEIFSEKNKGTRLQASIPNV